MRRLGYAAAVLALVAVVSGCASTSGGDSPASQAVAVSVLPAQARVAAAVSPEGKDQSCGNPTASLAPEGPLPAVAHMPAGSYMAQIVRRGYLIAGVDQNTLLWGYRDPINNQLEGFDIDMVRQVAIALFGDASPEHLHLVIVPNADRFSAVESGEVDIVAETATINCARDKLVDFSTEYYEAHQEILVPDGSPIDSIATLSGHRVCAAAGSTSISNLQALPKPPQVWQVNNETDCLVMLEQGQVDAVSTDDTILEGLAAQDPHVHIVAGATLSNEPYGMAISKSHPDFTRFVNAVLAAERSDGTWASIWDKWLSATLHSSAPPPPTPVYRA